MYINSCIIGKDTESIPVFAGGPSLHVGGGYSGINGSYSGLDYSFVTTTNNSATVSLYSGTFTSGADSALHIEGLFEYHSNREARVAGLSDGAVYRNGDQLCIVHHEN